MNKQAVLRGCQKMEDIGVGGLVRTGAWCENDLAMIVLSIGRSATDNADRTMEVTGKWLSYRIALLAGEIQLSANGYRPSAGFAATHRGQPG